VLEFDEHTHTHAEHVRPATDSPDVKEPISSKAMRSPKPSAVKIAMQHSMITHLEHVMADQSAARKGEEESKQAQPPPQPQMPAVSRHRFDKRKGSC